MNSDCRDRDLFAETPFDEVYAQKFDPIYIKKYGENVAILFPATDEKIFENNHYYANNNYDGKVLTLGSKFYWFYLDRDIDFNDYCIKNPIRGDSDIELRISADVHLRKGWNLIEESLESTQEYTNNDYKAIVPKTIHFSSSTPSTKKIKWFLIQILKDDKLYAIKKAYEIEPITQKQFKTWLPEKAGSLIRTSYELDKALEQSRSTKNNVYAVYENGVQKMEIAILDGAKNQDDLEMVNFSFAMDEEYQRDDKPASDKAIKNTNEKVEPHYISKEDTTLKTAQVISLFKNRIIVYANGENMTATQLWDAINTLKITSIND